MWRADGLLCASSTALELMSPAPFLLRLAAARPEARESRRRANFLRKG
jgi:hypothetical protein